jgi:hypothetical protein
MKVLHCKLHAIYCIATAVAYSRKMFKELVSFLADITRNTVLYDLGKGSYSQFFILFVT